MALSYNFYVTVGILFTNSPTESGGSLRCSLNANANSLLLSERNSGPSTGGLPFLLSLSQKLN